MDIEFSFFATVDRIDCTSKKVHLSPAYTYEENIWDENPKKFIHLLDFDAMQATGVKIKGLQLSGKIPYDSLVVGEKSSDGDGTYDWMLPFLDFSSSSSGKTGKTKPNTLKDLAIRLDFLAVCSSLLSSRLKFHVQGEMATEDGRADEGKIVVKRILWVERA